VFSETYAALRHMPVTPEQTEVTQCLLEAAHALAQWEQTAEEHQNDERWSGEVETNRLLGTLDSRFSAVQAAWVQQVDRWLAERGRRVIARTD